MSASSSISTEEQDLEESPVTTVSVESESPSSPSGDNGKSMLKNFAINADKGSVVTRPDHAKSLFYKMNAFCETVLLK
jgi:hypothetical protein